MTGPGAASSRPPAGMPLGELFEVWLPATFAASLRRASPDGPLVRAQISGAGGGVWELRARDGLLEVVAPAPGRRPDPDLLLRQSAVDVRAALEGDADLPTLLPARFGALDLLFLDPRDVDVLRRIEGRFLVEVAGRRGRRWSLDVGLGKSGVTAGRPRATVRLDGATFEGVASGRLPPMQPLLDGRIKVDGDRALAMQAMLVLASRLQRG